MADYDLLYQDTYIDALLATANELKTAGYIYKGVATPSTNPGTPTERVAYLASEPGTYTNFGGIVITSGLYSLTYAGGTWTGTQMQAGSDIEVVQTTGQSASDVMSQKAVTDEFDKTARITPNSPQADLDIADDNGNILARFSDGHFQTKKFNSKTLQIDADIEDDFAIKDENDYSIVQFRDGHIQTKNFNSSELKLKVGYSDEDFAIADESGFQIVTFSDGNIKTKNFDSKEVTTKYVDCLGDSLTMGFTSSGWFEPSLQNTLGGKYTVRNWGVGGEKGSTIMTRLGAAQVVFPQSFVLPADCSPVQIATSSSPMRNSFNGIAFTPLLQGTENDPTLKTRVINPCYVNGIECTMKYLGNDYYAQSPYTLERNYEGDRDVTISPHTQIFLNTGKQMAHSYISIVWIGENREISGQFNVDEVVLMNKTIAHYLSNTRYIFIGLHKLTGETAEDYEDKMIKAFGNKFFNLREYACTNMIYDCGMTPTAQDLQDMANGICPSSLLLDYSHFKPKSNEIIGIKLGEMCKELGYLNN